MNNLKSCPFCGGVPQLIAPGYEYYSPCWCKCTQCGAEGPTKSSELEAEKGWNERIQDDVERFPTIGGWISVKDRLPVRPPDVCGLLVRRQWYLVALESGTVLTLSYEFDEDRWQGVGSPVTHWMPLPEPPKEDEDD